MIFPSRKKMCATLAHFAFLLARLFLCAALHLGFRGLQTKCNIRQFQHPATLRGFNSLKFPIALALGLLDAKRRSNPQVVFTIRDFAILGLLRHSTPLIAQFHSRSQGGTRPWG
jgi:hypothetical protein